MRGNAAQGGGKRAKRVEGEAVEREQEHQQRDWKHIESRSVDWTATR